MVFVWNTILKNTPNCDILKQSVSLHSKTNLQMVQFKKRIFTSFLIALVSSTVLAQNPLQLQNKILDAKIQDSTKGLFIEGWSIGNNKVLQHFIDLANRTEINTYVTDIKEDDGYVSYASEVAEVKQLKNYIKKFDPVVTLSELHKNNIRVIGRVVCFKDPVMSLKRPDLALMNKNGEIWKDKEGNTWLNPYNKECWKYLVKIAKEAVKLGFDEIQFDYVRFTNNGDVAAIDYGKTKLKKYETINDFLAYARKEIPNTVISANVFGIICESEKDTEGIGQYLELIGENMDYISPMIYPFLYAPGQIVNNVAFPKPDLDPYGVVFNAVTKAKARIDAVKKYKAKLRPYLQDSTESSLEPGFFQTYGAVQVKQQIDAVYKAGGKGWLFWNSETEYSEDGFLPKAVAKK